MPPASATPIAVVWTLGAYSTYACIMLVRPLPGRRAQIVTLAIWPFVVLWLIFTWGPEMNKSFRLPPCAGGRLCVVLKAL